MATKLSRFLAEPFIGTTGKCHQQRATSDKKAAASLAQQQHHHTQPQQPPLPTLVPPPEDLQQTPQQQVTVAMRPVGCADLEDLIHLAGPLTEDALLKCLQARFCASQFFVSTGMLVGQIVLTASSFYTPIVYFPFFIFSPLHFVSIPLFFIFLFHSFAFLIFALVFFFFLIIIHRFSKFSRTS
jgi:hypothetical protein